MAFSSQNFTGVLDGTDVNELNKKIDYSKTHLKERKEVVEDILNNTDFYGEYFDNYFKTSITSRDALSSDVNVCKSLERMANYLLNSKEIKQEEDAEKVKYVFHTDENYFRKKVEREHSLSQVMSAENEEYEENIIHFLKTSETNHKVKKRQTPDLKNIRVSKVNSEEDVEEVTQIVNEYQSFIDYITEMLVTKDRSINRYLLTKTKGELTDDIILTKDSLLGIWGYKLKNTAESTLPNMDVFDFTNMDHVKGTDLVFINNKGKETKVKIKGLMYFKPKTLMAEDDFSFVLCDFEKTVEKANLTKREQSVLELLREGHRNVDIERILNISQKTVRYDIETIAKKIIRVGNKYDLEGMTD